MSTMLARALDAANLDLLLLGALADRMRAAERGDVVRIHLDRAREGEGELFDNPGNDAHTFLRRVATARLTAGGSIRIDAESVGLQLAQVALTFGADELCVPIDRLSLEVYGSEEKRVLRERELVGLIRSAGRVARIVERGVERDPDETTPAQRRFRAPGRDVQHDVGDA